MQSHRTLWPLAVLAYGLLACTKPAAPASAPSWRADTRYVYQVKLDSEQRAGSVPAPLADLSVTGSLQVEPLAATGDRQALGLRLSDVQVQSLQGVGPGLSRLSQELGARYEVLLRGGLVTGLRLTAGTSAPTVALLRTLASALQVAASSPDAKADAKAGPEVREYDSTGLAVVRYDRSQAGRVRKQKLSYELVLSRLAAPSGAPLQAKPVAPEVQESTTEVRLRAGVPVEVSLHERVTVPLLNPSSRMRKRERDGPR